jgi:hypothetical protein
MVSWHYSTLANGRIKMFGDHRTEESKKTDEQPKCLWDEMRSGEIGSKQTHPETGASYLGYLVGVTSEDNRRFLTPIAA